MTHVKKMTFVNKIMIGSTTEHKALFVRDCILGYNEIQMAPEDLWDMAFHKPKGLIYYKVMHFGLKNTGATY